MHSIILCSLKSLLLKKEGWKNHPHALFKSCFFCHSAIAYVKCQVDERKNENVFGMKMSSVRSGGK